MKSKEQIKALLADREYILMFMDEVEQADTFWLWHKFSSRHQDEQKEWGYHFRMFLLASFHGSLLSVRKLNDFFTGGKGRSDCVKADRFGFQNMTSPLGDELVERLNKYLAHMTFPGAELRTGNWHVDDFTQPVFARCLEFCGHLESSFLNPSVDGDLLGKVGSFKRGLRERLNRGVKEV